jgi:hypothetical protein
MKLVLTHECGDILLIDPSSNANQLITDIESVDETILKEKYRTICLIDHKVKLEHFTSVFCMTIPKGVEISECNIDNEKITLYTFTDDADDLKMDVSKMRVQNTKLTIAKHFLSHISYCKYKSYDYQKHIKNHCELESEINADCRRKMECDMQVFKEANEICINDKCERSLCHSFAKRMILHAKHRFRNIERDEIVELPFKKHDYVYYKYICSYRDIIQVYMIRIILV